MSVASVSTLDRLVLDAGPLIALLHGRDADHQNATAGFRHLAEARVRLITPLPIVFEVYKWLLYEASPKSAQFGLERMRRSLEIVYPRPEDLQALPILIGAMPTWMGSLEDALVALAALRLDAPVWTLNYRDLSAFRSLRFWNPA